MIKIVFFVVRSTLIIFYDRFSSLRFLVVLVLFFVLGNEFHTEVTGNLFILDNLSIALLILTIWLTPLIIICSKFEYWEIKKCFFIILTTLNTILMLVFLVDNIIFFLVAFEGRVIPTFILIMGWGGQPERLQAGIYLFFYTIVASIPLFIIIFHCFKNFRLRVFRLTNFRTLKSYDFFFMVFFLVAFLVKLPIYLFHLWLPKAHVEAPVAGSIILAGVLLKLRGYGLIRFTPFLILRIFNFSEEIISWSVSGGVIAGLICLMRRDIKILIALSSISHIRLVLRSFLRIKKWGIIAVIMIIIRHGICSSGIFSGANILYEKSGSRNLKIRKGIILKIPLLIILFFFISVLNIAAPPSLNFIREILSFIRILRWRKLIFPLLILLNFLPGAYILYFFSFLNSDKSENTIKIILNQNSLENLILFSHLWPLILLTFRNDLFSI